MKQPVSIIGTGSYVPEYRISTEELIDLVNPTPKQCKIARTRLGIETRAYESKIDRKTGRPEKDVDEVAMAKDVTEQALKSAGVSKGEVDLLQFVSCTQDQSENAHFSKTVMELHNRLDLPAECDPFEMDAGCGGFGVSLQRAITGLKGSDRKTAVVIASNATSKHLDASLYSFTENAWLSPFIFGDGAGAVVLQKSDQAEIFATHTEADSGLNLMEYQEVPGAHKLVYRIRSEVSGTYSDLMFRALTGISEAANTPVDNLLANTDRIFCHQANGRLLDEFQKKLGVDSSKIPKNVDTAGNLAAATIPVLLDQANMSNGESWLMLVVGAGAQIASAHGKF